MNKFFAPKPSSSAHTTKKPKEDRVPWVEKYRPKKVDELVYQDEVVAVLKKVLEGADLPNLLFYGPPGTGKTSAAVALCRQLFKTSELYRDRVLEMNASDERGIQIVRSKIKEFSMRAVAPTTLGACVALKIVILDEADAMTQPAQAAMRRTMEKYSKTTRFFLICNYVSRIIDPLTSRCAKFRFKPLPTECQLDRMRFICENEKVQLDDKALLVLIELCEGDLRKSVTYLQSLASSRQVTEAFIRQVTGRIDDSVIEKVLAAIKSLDADELMKMNEMLCREGHGGRQLLVQMFDAILNDDAFTDFQKANIFNKMAVCEARLLDGADEFLQLLDFTFCVQKQLVD